MLLKFEILFFKIYKDDMYKISRLLLKNCDQELPDRRQEKPGQN